MNPALFWTPIPPRRTSPSLSMTMRCRRGCRFLRSGCGKLRHRLQFTELGNVEATQQLCWNLNEGALATASHSVIAGAKVRRKLLLPHREQDLKELPTWLRHLFLFPVADVRPLPGYR